MTHYKPIQMKSKKINPKGIGIVFKKDDCASKILRVQTRIWEIENKIEEEISEVINVTLISNITLTEIGLAVLRAQYRVLLGIKEFIKSTEPE